MPLKITRSEMRGRPHSDGGRLRTDGIQSFTRSQTSSGTSRYLVSIPSRNHISQPPTTFLHTFCRPALSCRDVPFQKGGPKWNPLRRRIGPAVLIFRGLSKRNLNRMGAPWAIGPRRPALFLEPAVGQPL